MSGILDKEYQTYCTKRSEFCTDHLNSFVLIKEEEVVDFYESYELALRSGLNRFGNVPFLIKFIMQEEEVFYFKTN